MHNSLKAQYTERESIIKELNDKLKVTKEELTSASNERSRALSNLESTSEALAKTQTNLKASREALRRVQEKFGITEAGLEEALILLTAKAREGDATKVQLVNAHRQIDELNAIRDAYADNESRLHAATRDLSEKLKIRTLEAELLQTKICISKKHFLDIFNILIFFIYSSTIGSRKSKSNNIS